MHLCKTNYTLMSFIQSVKFATITYHNTLCCMSNIMLVKENIYWLALSFKALSTKVDLFIWTPTWKLSLLFGRWHLTMKLQCWDTSFPYATHKCEELKPWVAWTFKSCNFPGITKILSTLCVPFQFTGIMWRWCCRIPQTLDKIGTQTRDLKVADSW